MGMTTSTIIAKKKAYTCKACTKNIPTVCLCADRVRCQPEVFMVTEWDVKVSSNSVSAQCKLQNKYYQLNLTTVILSAALWLDPAQT